jgi:hypothetical protein
MLIALAVLVSRLARPVESPNPNTDSRDFDGQKNQAWALLQANADNENRRLVNASVSQDEQI